jgi:transcriptional regulator with XRE-family HTH domain
MGVALHTTPGHPRHVLPLMAGGMEPDGLGRAVQSLRGERGFSIEDLARSARVSSRCVASIERGERIPRLDELEKLAGALGIRVSALVVQVEQQWPNTNLMFARRLRELRTECGVSQERLALVAGIHRTAVSKLERGTSDPRLSTILRLAYGLHLPAEAFVKELAGTGGET